MPKRKTAARKRATKTKKLDDKANAIADVTPRQVLLMIIEDFEIQVHRIIETTAKKFERECIKSLSQLPDKTCLPLDIYNMPLQEFIDCGGSIEESTKAAREKKRKEFDEELSMKIADSKENKDPGNEDDDNDLFKTPAVGTKHNNMGMSTRGMSTRGMSTRQLRKRKPNQLEEVKMLALSKATGSPVDERQVMEGVIDEMMQGLMTNLLPQMKSKAAKAQATKAIESSLSAFKADLRQKREVSLVTPSLGPSGRSKRLRK